MQAVYDVAARYDLPIYWRTGNITHLQHVVSAHSSQCNEMFLTHSILQGHLGGHQIDIFN